MLMSIVATLFSCTSDSFDSINELEKVSMVEKDVCVKDGIVSFKSKDVFNEYFESLKNDSSSSTTRSVGIPSKIEGFTSLKDIKESITKTTRSGDAEENEEWSEEEYRLICCQELIPDERFENFMDTTMRVAVQDTIYKVTPMGTVYTTRKHLNELDGIENKINKDDLVSLGDKKYQISNDIYLYDTFGKISGDTLVVDCVDSGYNENNTVTRASSTVRLGSEDENTRTFNLSTYNWHTNGWGHLTTLFGILGYDFSETKSIDSKHRVKVRMYNLDYYLVATVGFNVSLQKCKKYLFIKVWGNQNGIVDNVVIGFEKFNARVNLNLNYNTQLRLPDYGHYIDDSWGYVNRMVYTGLAKYDFLKDWMKGSDGVATVWAGIKSYDEFNLLSKAPWEYTAKLEKTAIYQGLKYFENKANRIIPKRITNGVEEYGVAAISCNGVGKMTHTIRGIQCYPRCYNGKTISLYGRIGFTYVVGLNGSSGSGLSPFNFESFDTDGFDVFGAVYYDGRWTGIRVHQKESER